MTKRMTRSFSSRAAAPRVGTSRGVTRAARVLGLLAAVLAFALVAPPASAETSAAIDAWTSRPSGDMSGERVFLDESGSRCRTVTSSRQRRGSLGEILYEMRLHLSWCFNGNFVTSCSRSRSVAPGAWLFAGWTRWALLGGPGAWSCGAWSQALFSNGVWSVYESQQLVGHGDGSFVAG